MTDNTGGGGQGRTPLKPETKAQIDALGRVEMARLWRFSPSGHEFLTEPAFTYFNDRFTRLGGMSPEISKLIGWEG